MLNEDKLPSVEEYFEHERIKLLGDGVWRTAVCRFHQEKKTELTMRINMKKGQFFCYECGVSGKDFIEFHEKRYNLTFIEAARRLSAWKES